LPELLNPKCVKTHLGRELVPIPAKLQVRRGFACGKEWLIGVAPPGDLSDNARPHVEDIAAFRVPGDRLVKLFEIDRQDFWGRRYVKNSSAHCNPCPMMLDHGLTIVALRMAAQP
jgi:hypothetical protein